MFYIIIIIIIIFSINLIICDIKLRITFQSLRGSSTLLWASIKNYYLVEISYSTRRRQQFVFPLTEGWVDDKLGDDDGKIYGSLIFTFRYFKTFYFLDLQERFVIFIK